jgi:DNA repair exonuclease SbcCD ATPase subunit
MYGRHFNLAVEDVGPGVNVIAGPNGCGKTTLARAIEVLVWPTSHSWERPIVDGVFQLEGSRWHVNVESGRVQFQSSSGANGPPPVPPHEHRDRYHLYLHDLLSATEGSEKDLAQVILQEAQGGYDVPGAAGALGLGEYKKGRSLTETQNLLGAQKRVEEARQKQQDLEEEERSLNELEQQREEAREAAVRRDALTQATALREAEKSAQEAEAELKDFPEDMEPVQGDEADRLSELRQERKKAKENKEEANRKIEDAESRIDENLLPEEGLPDGTFETLRTAVTKWETAQNTVEQAERERSRAKEAEKQEWDRLQSEDRGRVADLSLPQVDAVQSFAESRLEVKGKEKTMEAMERLFGEATPEIEPDTLRRGIERLEEWLREPSSLE